MSAKKLSASELITRRLSHKLNLSEDLIDKIISFQWKSARAATMTSRTVEITNFGTFKVRPKKVELNIRKLEVSINKHLLLLESMEDPEKIRKTNVIIEIMMRDLEYLKTKL